MTEKLSRRAALTGLAALAPATAVATMPAAALGAEPDPVFAAINAHKAAMAEIDAVNVAEVDVEDEEQHEEHEERLYDAIYDEAATLLVVLNTMPSTPLGLAHALAHMGARHCSWDAEKTPTTS